MKDKKKEYKCLYCNKIYKTESQICPKCHRVMVPLNEKNEKKTILMEVNNGTDRM